MVMMNDDDDDDDDDDEPSAGSNRYHEPVLFGSAGSNLYCEPAPPAFSAEVPVRTCTANRLHRFTGSPTYGFG